MARAAGLLGLLSLAPMVAFAASGASEVSILGEEYVKDVDDYASRVGQEAKNLIKTPLEDWNFYGSYDRGLKVYWRAVKDNQVQKFSQCRPAVGTAMGDTGGILCIQNCLLCQRQCYRLQGSQLQGEDVQLHIFTSHRNSQSMYPCSW